MIQTSLHTLYTYADAAGVFRESILRILCLDVGVRARILEHVVFVCSWTRGATPEMTTDGTRALHGDTTGLRSHLRHNRRG